MYQRLNNASDEVLKAQAVNRAMIDAVDSVCFAGLNDEQVELIDRICALMSVEQEVLEKVRLEIEACQKNSVV